jgi:3-hydroxymyristoyl/3-hydroxydecanoyl-(acyl carrier protein) dehydratase
MGETGAFTEIAIGAGEARATLRREHLDELCRGHFPDDPLVPGAMLVGIMAELACLMMGEPDRAPTVVERAVFLQRVVPRTDVTVTATRRDGRVDAEVRVAGTPAARGTFVFGTFP